MLISTLCYIQKDGCWLMLHRVKKKNDVNRDKWIGVGGKCEPGESPDECLLREVREETGLTLTDWQYRGLVHFRSNEAPDEEMHLYTATDWTGTMVQGDACAEGLLEWVPMEQVEQLPLWEGDKVFLRLLRENAPLFELTLRYRGSSLAAVELNGAPALDGINRKPVGLPQPVTVRAAQEWDLSAMNEQALERWRRNAARNAGAHRMPGDAAMPPPDFVANWCRTLRQPGSGILLAECGQLPVGWAVLSGVPYVEDTLLVSDLWLAEAAQGTDTDLMLLRRAARFALQHGRQTLHYWADGRDEKTLQRYEALGARRGGVQGMMYSWYQELVWQDLAALAGE